MKTFSPILVALAVSVSPLAAYSAPSDIAPAAKRVATVELAARLAKPNPESSYALPEGLRNPFNPAVAVSDENRLGRPASDEDLLVLLADRLNATGSFAFGDSLILLLGQKKVKLHERIPVSFDGVSYDVELVGIERNAFTLRLNKAEVTRPIIKPGK